MPIYRRDKLREEQGSEARLGYEAKPWRMADAFAENCNRLEQEPCPDPKELIEYRAANVFSALPGACWEPVRQSAGQATIVQIVDEAMEAAERDKPSLNGLLPKDYAHPALDKCRPGLRLDLITNLTVSNLDARSCGTWRLLSHNLLTEWTSFSQPPLSSCGKNRCGRRPAQALLGGL